jgi:RNA binding exosome subunit
LVIFLFQIVLILLYITSNDENSEEEVDIGWYPESSRNLSDYINFDENTAIIEPLTICRSNDSILVIIAVASAPNNFERRRAIRETWGNTSHFNHDLFENLHRESEEKYLKINIDKWREYIEEVRFYFDFYSIKI